MSKIYIKMKTFETYDLRAKLREHLHSDRSFVFNLTCSDNQNRTVACPNGFCQLIRKGKSNVDRRCIPEGDRANPSGVLIELNSMEGLNTEAAVTYACNKPMCNGAHTDAQVQVLVAKYELLLSSDLTTTATSTAPVSASNMTSSGISATTVSTSTETTTSSMAILHRTRMIFQWMSLLTMTSLLKL